MNEARLISLAFFMKDPGIPILKYRSFANFAKESALFVAA